MDLSWYNIGEILSFAFVLTAFVAGAKLLGALALWQSPRHAEAVDMRVHGAILLAVAVLLFAAGVKTMALHNGPTPDASERIFGLFD